VERGLGGQIPSPPTNVLSVLPPLITDRLGHPVALLTLREVVRDDDGSLSEVKDWTWWGLELVRRVIRDYWVDGNRGVGAEGVVLVIDVAGAGYRNMVSRMSLLEVLIARLVSFFILLLVFSFSFLFNGAAVECPGVNAEVAPMAPPM
jgi:hypothetical protein